MHAKTFFGAVAGALIMWAMAVSASAADAKFDWQALEEEAVAILSRYIQVNTTNPPGNEINAARFLQRIFERENIEARIIESAPGRGNIFARLRGNGSNKALLLLHHMDVVPADPKEWQEPPFSGAIKSGEIWGRGALDNKGPGVAELMTLLALKRQNIALKGDVIFLGSADEEAGGAMGVGYLLEKNPELFTDLGLVLNEGGGIRLDKTGKAREYSVSLAEKTPLWLRLTAQRPTRPRFHPRNRPGGEQARGCFATRSRNTEAPHQGCARGAELLCGKLPIPSNGAAAQEISRSSGGVARSSICRRVYQRRA